MKIFLVLPLIFCLPLSAQTGINTVYPKGTLHVDPLHNSTQTVSPTDEKDDFIVTATGTTSVGTITPAASAKLQINSTTEGFLPPRVTTAERDLIASPADGLIIYNTTSHCLQVYKATAWSACLGCGNSSSVININSSLHPCFEPDAPVSRTSCSQLSGAVLNDNPATSVGIEYDYDFSIGGINYVSALATGNTDFTTRTLVEINSQCWFARNADRSDFVSSGTTGTGSNYVAPNNVERLFAYNTAFATGTPASNATRVTTFQPQGICPAGFHIANDCEWMYMEISLGMPPLRAIGNGNPKYRIILNANIHEYTRDAPYVNILPLLNAGGSSGLTMPNTPNNSFYYFAPGFNAPTSYPAPSAATFNPTNAGTRQITTDASAPKYSRRNTNVAATNINRRFIRCILN
jgi:hypothetical protein